MLEPRKLMSGWSTVDSLPTELDGVIGMTTDKSGNVYAAGDGVDPATGTYGVLVREKAANSSNWVTRCNLGASFAYVQSLAVDSKGDIFLGNEQLQGGAWLVSEVANGSSSPVAIDRTSGQITALGVDPAGNVYAVGSLAFKTKPSNAAQYQWAVRKGTFNSATGAWTFSTVDQLATTSSANGEAIVTTTVGGVSSTAVYVVGSVGSNWVVRESINGGSWSQVDSFRYDSTGIAASQAEGVAADLAGNVYVVGNGESAVITGYNKNKTPIYHYVDHWLVRKSANGGTSWTTDDDAILANGDNQAMAICVNPQSGAMDVAGDINDSTGAARAVVRSNAGGTWSTVDNYAGSTQSATWYNPGSITADPAGDVYAGGIDNDNALWIIRSQPAAPTSLVASPDATSPSSQIDLAWTNNAAYNSTGSAIYRSTDGIHFSLLATVGAGVSSYSDAGLAAGTTYYYYVVTLLNSDGSSAPSGTASSTTSA
jgi:hypothetical protein